MRKKEDSSLTIAIVFMLIGFVFFISRGAQEQVVTRRRTIPMPVKLPMQIPRLPVTVATQRVSPYQQIGFLYSDDVKHEMLPLLGRRVHNGSTNWNYYTVTNNDLPIKIPIHVSGRNCYSQYGCKELYDGDQISVKELSAQFTVRIYEHAW